MMQRKFKMHFIAYFVLSIANINASNASGVNNPDLLNLPQEAFNNQADAMSFKSLRDFSLVNKESLEKVKAYFKFLEARISNAKCPYKLDYSNVHGKLNSDQSGIFDYVKERSKILINKKLPTLEIDGIHWGIVHKEMKPGQTWSFVREKIIKNDPDPIFGAPIWKMCYYKDDSSTTSTQDITLSLMDELMTFSD